PEVRERASFLEIPLPALETPRVPDHAPRSQCSIRGKDRLAAKRLITVTLDDAAGCIRKSDHRADRVLRIVEHLRPTSHLADHPHRPVEPHAVDPLPERRAVAAALL